MPSKRIPVVANPPVLTVFVEFTSSVVEVEVVAFTVPVEVVAVELIVPSNKPALVMFGVGGVTTLGLPVVPFVLPVEVVLVVADEVVPPVVLELPVEVVLVVDPVVVEEPVVLLPPVVDVVLPVVVPVVEPGIFITGLPGALGSTLWALAILLGTGLETEFSMNKVPEKINKKVATEVTTRNFEFMNLIYHIIT